MTKSELKSIIDEVRRLVRHLSSVPTTYRDPAERSLLNRSTFCPISSPDGTVTLEEPEADLYIACLRKMIEVVASNGQWSDNELSTRLSTMVLSALKIAKHTPDQFPTQLNALLDDLRKSLSAPPVRWESIFPVLGLYDECLPYKFGIVTFEAGAGIADELYPEGTPHGTSDLAVTVRKLNRDNTRKMFAQKIAARAACFAADEAAAKALNLKEILRTLDVVNFYGDVYRPSAYRARMFVESEVPHHELGSITHEIDQPKGKGGGSRERTGSLDDVWLPPLDSDEAAAFGLAVAHQLLASQSKSEVTTRVLAALQWAGRASIERRSEQVFLDYAIALEALLLGRAKGADVTFRLKVRAAHLAAGPTIESRRRYASSLAGLYDLRSEIVHQGRTDVSTSDVRLMREFAKGCIITALKHSELLALSTDKELNDWFDDKVYSG